MTVPAVADVLPGHEVLQVEEVLGPARHVHQGGHRGDLLDLLAALSAYIGLPLFLALWLGHRLVTGSRMVRYEDADLTRATA